jgi:hypothetical protein
MWLCDLQLAVKAVRAFMPYAVFEKVVPCADGGIAFYTTYESIIKWYTDGRVEERSKTAWRS